MSSACPVSFYRAVGTPRMVETGGVQIHHWAAIDADENIAGLRTTAGDAVLTTKDYFGNTPLHYAAACGSYKCARLIVEAFPEDKFLNVDMITPAHIAAQAGDVKMLEILHSSKVLLTGQSRYGYTPLHFAIVYQQLDAVRYLLENGPRDLRHMVTISAESSTDVLSNLKLRFLSPFDLAQAVGGEEIQALLAKYDCLPSLHCAVIRKDFRAIAYRLFPAEGKPLVDVVSQTRKATPLHVAAGRKFYEVCHALIQKGASVEIVDVDGFSPLDVAVFADSFEAVSVIERVRQPVLVSRAMLLAADLGREKLLMSLATHPPKFDGNFIDEKTGDSILIRLMKRERSFCIDKVLENCRQTLSQTDNAKANILHYTVCNKGCISLVKRLIDANVSLQSTDCNGLTPLGYHIRATAEPGDETMLRLLDSSDRDAVDKFGLTPRAYAIIGKNKYFKLDDGAPFHSYDVDVGALMKATSPIPAKVNIYDYDKEQTEEVSLNCLKLFSPTYTKNVESEWVKHFLKEHPSGILKEASLVHITVLFGADSAELDRLPISRAPDVLDRPDANGMTPFHLAVMIGRVDMITALINKNVNICEVDKDGNNALHYAKSVDTLKRIIDVLANGNISPAKQNNAKETPIHQACKNGAVEMLKLMVTQGNSDALTLQDAHGKTALDYALNKRHMDCIDFLHSNGVENRLISAIQDQDEVTVKKLLNRGYPAGSMDSAGNTPLLVAARKNCATIAQLLIKSGAEANIQVVRGAAQSGSMETIRLVIGSVNDITDVRLEDQPFQACKVGTQEREFLYKYWKRRQVGNDVIDFFSRVLKGLDTIGVEQSLAVLKKYGIDTDGMEDALTSVMADIKFVTTKITEKNMSGKKRFNYMTSVHHLCMVFLSLDIASYCAKFREKIDPALDTLRQNDKIKNRESEVAMLMKHRMTLMFPILWYVLSGDLICRFKSRLLEDVDDMNVCNGLFKNIEESLKTIKTSILEKQDDVTREIVSTVITDSDARSITGSGAMYVQGRINEIVRRPTFIMRPQMMSVMREFCGSRFIMPRSISFAEGQNVWIGMVGEFLVIGKKEAHFVVPLWMLNVRVDNGKTDVNDGLSIVSPVGSFSISFPSNKDHADGGTGSSFLLKLAILHQKYMNDNLSRGALGWAAAKKAQTFESLIAYQPSGLKYMKLRFVLIRANKEEECYDTCYMRSVEGAAEPVAFSSKSRILDKATPYVVFCG